MQARRFLAVLPVVTVVLTLLLAAPAWAQVDELDIDKSDDPDPVDKGDLLVYILEVTNEGTVPLTEADNIEVEDNLPSKVDFDDVESDDDFRCTRGGGSVRCELRTGETLIPGETAEIEIVVEPDETGTITNRARVFADNDLIDTATESTRVEGANNNNNNDGSNNDNTIDDTVNVTQESTTADTTADTTTADTLDSLAETTTADNANRDDSFRCEFFLRAVRDDRGALRGQYRDDELIVQRFEQCLSADVLASTIPDRRLPFTGGPSLPFGGGLLLLVAAAVLAGRVIRR